MYTTIKSLGRDARQEVRGRQTDIDRHRQTDIDRRFWSMTVMTLDEQKEHYAILSLSNREVRREGNK